MNELQRMQYLDAMGIDMFVPRFLLSNALLPRQAELPADAVFAPPQIVLEDSEARVLPERAAVVNRIVNLDFTQDNLTPIAHDIETLKDEPVKNIPPDTARVQTTVQFSLALWRIDSEVMVVDSRRPRSALPTEALLANILFQLNVLRQPLPRAEFLNWPMPGTGGNHGWDAAREMVQAFLEGRLSSNPIKRLVIMGAEAGNAILEKEVDCQTEAGFAGQAFGAEAMLLPSLADMLYQPELKKIAWKNLYAFFNPAFTSTL
jgi:hypothetical protein